ncbi:methionyl-tRNA formyltransferase [Enterocloster clostridioformis]|uniref:methionyl-tRNA formyltransferase n=1 Tax=Enterocloster clostridioformis TaxID=1531 RepID=UPI00080C5137|nr:methionyl-tRNA formyltransferase [Enterocloster clostridioformis]ANU44876.1 methionyl-tRNA formyltransferase [Lachnoclostridium sp. YL32]NDO27755.1 methionyl-tRNA formyltransferase [Enterocloster clostridioformis]OXE70218.1 methionyl-tRNA formyltransferase [Enterocloster clostridioformis]QQR00365.1 methionyl-tRNA formyltransferase [Enterocloster clostridioformis]
MRIVFMGTPDFSVPALKALVEAGHQVIAVVTQPDKPKGRGKEVQMTPVKIQAMEYGIPVYQPAKVREASFVEILQGMEADVYVVIAFGQLLPKAVLELPKYGCINIHASLLPKYRGAAPIQWCVIDGERETGITTMMMDVGLDTGDMLEKTVIPIEEKETGGSLHDKLSLAGGALILSTLKKLEEGTLVRTPQTDEGTCYAKMLTKSLGDIDWNQSAVSIERLIRGLNPWPSAYTLWNGKTIKIWSADVTTGREAAAFLSESGVPSETGITPGTVVCSDKHSLVVCTGDGLLSVRELQMEGKKRMDTPAFLRGYPIPEGDVFVKKESD